MIDGASMRWGMGRKCERRLLHHDEREARKCDRAGNRVDDVDLARVGARLELLRGNLQLEDDGTAVLLVDHRPLHRWRLEYLHAAAVEGEAGPEIGNLVGDRRVVDLVVEVDLLVAADGARQ